MKPLVLALVVAAATVPANAAGACAPDLALDYTTGEATFTWSLDPTTCGMQGTITDFRLDLEVRRTAIGEETEQVAEAGTDCAGQGPCAVEAIIPHPDVERGRYQGVVSYAIATAYGNGHQAETAAGTFSYGCLSAILVAGC